MHPQAEFLLEHVTELLDATTGPNRQGECVECRDLCEAPSSDEDAIAEHSSVHDLLAAVAMGTLQGIDKLLIGTNILTPCLVSRGWMLWRTPLLSSTETEAVKRANLQCSERIISMSELIPTIRNSTDVVDLMQLHDEIHRLIINAMFDYSHALREVLRSQHQR